MKRPSGVQAGSHTRTSSSVKTARGFDPSASISHRLFWPPRSETNAIVLPSGEIVGWKLTATPEPWVRLTASPPLAGTR